MQPVSFPMLCGVLFSVMRATLACDLSTALAPELEPLAALGLECLVRDLLCLLEPLVEDVNNLVGLVLTLVFILFQLFSSIGMSVGTFLSGVITALRQALGNSQIGNGLRDLITSIIRILPQVLGAVGGLLTPIIG